jgi:hypothetical protein
MLTLLSKVGFCFVWFRSSFEDLYSLKFKSPDLL